jgi:tellurite resistance protein
VTTSDRHGALAHLYPGWFTPVMGLAGLSLAWHRAAPTMGEPARSVALVVGALAALVFGALALATLWRAVAHPQAWAQDRRHPVRHTFVATLPSGIILVATAGVAAVGPSAGTAVGLVLQGLWWTGCLSMVVVTLWVMARWWRPGPEGGLAWPSVTPALIVPVVGHVLAPLAGVALGHPDWSAAQFGIGLAFWLPTLGLLMARLVVAGPLPERLLPTVFIVVAPPAAAGLSALELGAPPVIGWMLWGVAVFALLWAGTTARRIVTLPFGLTHWALSFPLAATAGLTLRLGQANGPMGLLGLALLALASFVIAALSLATLRGLRDGSLLQPETVAVVASAPEPGTGPA